MVVFEQKCCIRAKVVVFRQKWLYSDKSDSIRAKVVVFGQRLLYSNWLYLVKSVCILEKAVVFGQGGCIGTKWLY